MSATFNDKQLADLVLACGAKSIPADIEYLLERTLLSNAERNQLLTFLYENRYANNKAPSMSSMRTEILKKIGAKDDGARYRNTVNAEELRAIYKYIMGVKV